MVTDQLVEVADSRPDPLLEPFGEPFVHVCPSLLGHALVRRIADQVVAEAEAILAEVTASAQA